MANTMDPVLIHHTFRERQPAAVPELPNDQLISHPSKVMLKITLNRLKPQAEKIIAEEQAGYRAGRSTTEQIFNLRILCEKISPAPARPLPCLHRLQEGLRQDLACSFVSNHEDAEHQRQAYPNHQKPL